MDADMPLFDDDATAAAAPATPAPVADWQIDLLRKALDARQLGTTMERRQAIEAAAGRPVESLRALTHDEALKVLSSLGPAPTPQSGSRSAWDQRDEDTWIDRL